MQRASGRLSMLEVAAFAIGRFLVISCTRIDSDDRIGRAIYCSPAKPRNIEV